MQVAFNKQPVPVGTDSASSTWDNLDKKRWAVRGLLLAAIGTIIGVKISVILFSVVDAFTGFYMLTTTSVLLFYLVSGWLKYKDPWEYAKVNFDPNYKPLVSILVAVKNEESNIVQCVTSCMNSSYENKEVIIVDDGSTDKTPQMLDDLKRNLNFTVIHLSKNVGKKQAIEKAHDIAKGDIIVSMDSDTLMDSEAVSRAVKIFSVNPKLGAVVAHGRVKGAKTGNLLQKIQDAWFDGQFRVVKGAESAYSSVTCCSGSFSAFRREAISKYIHAWAHDKFLGGEFRFATDRLMTGFILGYEPKNMEQPKADSTPLNATKPFTEKDNFELKSTIENKEQPKWDIEYSKSMNVEIGVPTTFTSFLKQQIRWRKSFIRSVFVFGAIYWKRSFPMNLVYYLGIILRTVRPYILFHSLLFLPLSGDYITPVFFLTSVFFVGMVHGIDFRLRNPGSSFWLYRPLVTMMTTFIITWLIFVALIRIKDNTWR